jgi:hypothetical protein
MFQRNATPVLPFKRFDDELLGLFKFVIGDVDANGTSCFETVNGVSFLPSAHYANAGMFGVIGVALRQCLLDGIPLKLEMPLLVYRFLLFGVQQCSNIPLVGMLRHLRMYDSDKANGINAALLSDVSSWDLEALDLRGMPSGITNANKHEALRRMCFDILIGSRLAALDAMRAGLMSADVSRIVAELGDESELRTLFVASVRARQEELHEIKERGLAIDAMVAVLGRGHAFTCPNGHVYFVGECGGPMQVGRCASCGAAIGGTQHRLIADNNFANVDGARGPAYPVH